MTLTSSGVPENSPTAFERTFLAASKFLISHYTNTKFMKSLHLSSYPKGNDSYFFPG
jgi:hypothetical protein